MQITHGPVIPPMAGSPLTTSTTTAAAPSTGAADAPRLINTRSQASAPEPASSSVGSGDGSGASSQPVTKTHHGDEWLLEQAREARVKQALQAQQERLDREQIQALSARDREVRAHEQAHVAVGGRYAGAPKYQYERGPDGVHYAVGGEVPISTSKEATPEETLRKAQVVRRAALAPAEPSPQDRKVAAQATRMEAEARREILETQQQTQARADEEERAHEDLESNERPEHDANEVKPYTLPTDSAEYARMNSVDSHPLLNNAVRFVSPQNPIPTLGHRINQFA